MSTQTAILLGVVLLLGNAFFVGAEFALVSARRTQIEPAAEQGSRLARSAIMAMEQVSLVMAGAQFGITACSLGLGAVAEPALAHLLEPVAKAVGLPHGAVHPVAFSIALALVVYLHVVLGEMVPKNLALAGPERAALVFGAPMIMIVTILKPIVFVLNATANAALRLVGIEPRAEISSVFTREQVEALVDESRAEGLLGEGEYERLSGALGFTARTVADVYLPMDGLQTVSRGARAMEVEAICAETGFSRFPVVGDTGALIGYLHIKDVLADDGHGRAQVVEDRWIRSFANVQSDDSLVDALQTLQSKGAHMARVVDANGTVIGVATLEDVIEELVGEIRDAAHH
ncbi:hemolysin family protein [Nocardioides marmorisolisilvae]|uniref:HlyC/CorC family transporter n=1 Tax=Nocardioides marmorisolisilvae TaxID=1542737 RepID=A0A3N0DTS5_9ACTN|nr:hemolysin family protein [Nocardioides marmorisolisilvae]RNL78911.1 HlyC/CorC family transporter [Nocardioides marmorisolisilvae]